MRNSLTVIVKQYRMGSKTESEPEEFGASVFTPTLWIAISSY